MNVSLEDQRRALLEQIEASRAVYRRMLSGETADASLRTLASMRSSGTAAALRSGERIRPAGRSASGRSRPVHQAALQWALDHPILTAASVALLVLAVPRVVAARRQRKQRPTAASERALVAQAQTGGTSRALVTAALLLLRDPARLKAAGRLAGMAWHWLQQRRTAGMAGRSGRSGRSGPPGAIGATDPAAATGSTAARSAPGLRSK